MMDKHIESFVTVRSALAMPLVPLQYLVSWSTSIVGHLKTNISTHNDLIQENLQLKTEQLLLRSQLQRLLALENENNYLKALSKSSGQIKAKTLIAELLNVVSEPFVHQVVLNKGLRHGVYVGQPVFDAYGVMGQVMQVGPISSRVLLITDPRHGIAVQNARNGMRAVAMGDGYSNNLQLMYVPKTADIKVGDLFLTSGLGDHFPEGYPVGKVVVVSKDPSQPFSTIAIQPHARLDSSRQVLLLWYRRHE